MKPLDRMVNFGGETMTYGEMFKQLREIAEASDHPDPQVLVNCFLQGFDLSPVLNHQDLRQALVVLEAFGRQRFVQPQTASRGQCIGMALGAGLDGPDIVDASESSLENANFHLSCAAVHAIHRTPGEVKRKGRRLTITLPECWE